jgi:hypothetical protein
VPRVGAVEGLTLENGSRRLKVDLEVADLSGGEEMIIGIDLFEHLGYSLQNIPFTWPGDVGEKEASTVVGMPVAPDSDISSVQKSIDQGLSGQGNLYPFGVGSDGIHSAWRQVLADNASIPASSRCTLEGSTVRIDTGTALPVWVRQYPIAQVRHEAVSKRVQEWLSYGWIVPAPSNCQWNIPLVAAEKPSSNGGPPGVRVCLDARLLNNVLVTEIDSNLPGCREILDSLGKFEWISRIDLADCYHQFELAEEDRAKTAFTWDGLQYMFAVVPIGLRIMKGHVQRLLELALGRTGRKPFQDDVGVASGSAEQHVTSPTSD